MKSLIPIVLTLALSGCENHCTPAVLLLPEKFQGNTIVVWNEPGASKLPVKDGKLVLKFPTTGIIVTSTKQEFGVTHDKAYYIDSSGAVKSPAILIGVGVGVAQREGHEIKYSQYSIQTKLPIVSGMWDEQLTTSAFRQIHPAPNQSLE